LSIMFQIPLTIRSWYTHNLLFPVEDILRGIPTTRFYNLYREAQWWSQDRNKEYRCEALTKLIEHAYRTVPFYKRRMQQAGISPNDIHGPEDLYAIPYLTREDVINNLPDLISREYDVRTLVKRASSGSTGQIVTSYQDKIAIAAGIGAFRIGWEMGNYRFGMRNISVWGNRVTVEETWKTLGSKVKQWVYQNKRIAAYRLTDDHAVRSALNMFLDFQPEYLDGYTNAIYFLAVKARELGIDGLRCRGVLTTAETLFDYQRDLITKVFGPVYDGYGSGEVLGVAYQCATNQDYHIVEPHVIVEYDSCNDSGFNELVLTDLNNYSMPFIRYKVGDLAIPSDKKCLCGRQWATLHRIVGRTTDLISTPTGGALLVPSFFGSSLIRQLPKIQQYQIAKVAPDKIIIRIRSTPDLSKTELNFIHGQLAPYLNGKISYELEQVGEFPLVRSGKFKLVVDETKAQ